MRLYTRIYKYFTSVLLNGYKFGASAYGGVCSRNFLYIEIHERRAVSREVATCERRFKGSVEPAAKGETHEDRRGERG
jgi:hypothetical protein